MISSLRKYWTWRELLGHFLFIATAFNWLMLFVLMWYHNHVFVSETHIILYVEIPLSTFAFGWSVYWFVKRTRQFKAWDRLFDEK